MANIGNWKKQRRQENKDIYKCQECDCKLEVEKKGPLNKVRVINPYSSEAHNWFDTPHLIPFSDQGEENNDPEGRLHSSVEAFFKLSLRTQTSSYISPDELIDSLRRERSKLYQFFKPSIAQVA